MTRTRTLTALFALGRLGAGVGLVVMPGRVAFPCLGLAATALTPRAALPRNARRGTVALGGGSIAAGLGLLRAASR